jgi:hypothetical protein
MMIEILIVYFAHIKIILWGQFVVLFASFLNGFMIFFLHWLTEYRNYFAPFYAILQSNFFILDLSFVCNFDLF